MAATIGRFCGAGLLKSGNGVGLQQVNITTNPVVFYSFYWCVKKFHNLIDFDTKTRHSADEDKCHFYEDNS